LFVCFLLLVLVSKLLNVREAAHKQIMENAEIVAIKKILGLQQGKEYTDTKTLRYGHLMIMTDQVFAFFLFSLSRPVESDWSSSFSDFYSRITMDPTSRD